MVIYDADDDDVEVDDDWCWLTCIIYNGNDNVRDNGGYRWNR